MSDRPGPSATEPNAPRFTDPSEALARRLDAEDPLAAYRRQFYLPRAPDGAEAIYLCGNSLGLQPRTVRPAVEQELDDWARLAVDAHFDGRTPWYSYHEVFTESGARLVGGVPGEVVYMNGLTVNLHLMMATFYRPTPERHRILIEDCAFPSDIYAVQSQIRWHGYDPDEALLVARPRAGERLLRMEDVEELLAREGARTALVLLGGVNYVTGQLLDMRRITAAGHARGCVVGFDLAHAAGNVELRLHDWDVDFACWCTYKYLNCGPGSVAGCFVHERHARNTELPRFGGWWGNDPQTRFRMHMNERFVPVPSADAWQLSNPPILSMAALRASLGMFDEVGMAALRAKSRRLTAYLEYLLEGLGDAVRVITPREPSERGCQLSIEIDGEARAAQRQLQEAGVVCDTRPPNIIRAASVPLYNTFRDVWRFVEVLRGIAGPRRP